MGLFGGMGGPFNRKTNAPPYPGQDVPQDVPEYRPPNTLHRIIGGLGDALSTWGGGQATFIPQLMQRQQQQAQMQQAERQQRQRAADAAAQWKIEQQWKIDHPAPINNDTVNDYEFRVKTLGKAAADEWLKSASDPIVTVTLPRNRGIYSGPRSGLAAALGGGGGAPVAQRPAIGAELPDPRLQGGAGQAGPGTFHPSAVMDAVIGVESGGRPGVLGPQTPYGQAQGLSQMLPATAQAMAKKLGVPWRPDLMTGKDANAAAYQRALGQAYLEEGIAATGSVAGGIKYYHGGPNRKMWGPKTRKYASDVQSRLGGK